MKKTPEKIQRVPKSRRRFFNPQLLAFMDALADDPADQAAWHALRDWVSEGGAWPARGQQSKPVDEKLDIASVLSAFGINL